MGRKKKIDIERESQQQTHTIEIEEKKVTQTGADITEQTKSNTQQSKESEEKFEIVDSIDFFNGKNKLSVRMSKRVLNRGYKIQIFLNDDNEIRSSTYNGPNPANSYWKLLKSSLSNS